MDPVMMALFSAANNPTMWGPLLDALGPSFGPDMLIPKLQQAGMLDGAGGTGGMFGPIAGPTAGTGAPSTGTPMTPETLPSPFSMTPSAPTVQPGADPFAQSPFIVGGAPTGVPGLTTGTLPPEMTAPDPLTVSSITPQAPTVTAPPAPGSTYPGAMSMLQRSGPLGTRPTGPQVQQPQAPTPVFSGGVAGAQKAPELGVQASTGGTPAQLLMQALLARGQTPNPLRVPTLAHLLGGGT